MMREYGAIRDQGKTYYILGPDERNASGWEIMFGHGCFTLKEAEDYCTTLNAKDFCFRVVDYEFDVNDPFPPFGKPVFKKTKLDELEETVEKIDLSKLNPEAVAQLTKLWEECMQGLK